MSKARQSGCIFRNILLTNYLTKANPLNEFRFSLNIIKLFQVTHITGLVGKGILVAAEDGGHSTNYLLADL